MSELAGRFSCQRIDPAGHSRLDAGSGILVQGAGGRELVELAVQRLKLVFGFIRLAGIYGRFQVFDLGLDHTFARPVRNPSLGVLTNSFLGR